MAAPFHVSVKGQYALQALLDLTLQETHEPVKIAAIARRQRIPQKFLELILATLKQGGFVDSRRGVEGGYFLARAPDRISVGEVLRFVAGSRPGRSVGGKSVETPFDEMWQRVERCVSEILDRTTFAEIARRWKEKQSAYVPNWEI
jgi:Rrf2 family protein